MIRNALQRFMYGRYGNDTLNNFLTILFLVLYVLYAVTRVYLFNLLSTVVLVWEVFRMFSRNHPKRRAENAKFMAWWGPKKNAITGAKARRTDKAHKYVKCSCGTYCRVPRNIGTVELTCPKCGAKHKVKT